MRTAVVNMAMALMAGGLIAASVPAAASPVIPRLVCAGPACEGLVEKVGYCIGSGPIFGPYDPLAESRPFTMRRRCNDRLADPSARREQPGGSKFAPSRRDEHRGSPFSGFSRSPHSYGPMFDSPSSFFPSDQ